MATGCLLDAPAVKAPRHRLYGRRGRWCPGVNFDEGKILYRRLTDSRLWAKPISFASKNYILTCPPAGLSGKMRENPDLAEIVYAVTPFVLGQSQGSIGAVQQLLRRLIAFQAGNANAGGGR